MPVSNELSKRMMMLDKKKLNEERDEKDREFMEAMKAIEMESAKRQHSIKSKKRELRGAQRQSKKKVEKIKEERSGEYETSDSTRQIINKTYQELELSAKAHTFDVWCNECGCIHLEDIFRDDVSTSELQKE